MMSQYIPDNVRKKVAGRANYRCEYCRIFERHSFLSFHIEHIVSLKHQGSSELSNLAYSCSICNINKGSDVATFLDNLDEPVRFYHPRRDIWNDHFRIEPSGFITSISKIGTATIKILDLNHPDSIIERSAMIIKGYF